MRIEQTMQRPRGQWIARTAGALSAVALVMGLVGCNRADNGSTVGQKVDSAIDRTEQAARNAKDEAKDKMASAESSMKNSDTSNKVAGAVDDMTITASVSASLAKDPDLSAIKIDVDTKGGVVTLTGPAPTAMAKDRATTLAQNVKGVSSVNNQLEVKAG